MHLLHLRERRLLSFMIGVALLATACSIDGSSSGIDPAIAESEPEETALEETEVDESVIEAPDTGEPAERPNIEDLVAQDNRRRVAYEGPACVVDFITTDLPGNREDAIPAGTLNVVLFYDGRADRQTEVRLGLSDGGWIPIGGDAPGGAIDVFGLQIETRVYELSGCSFNGDYEVDNATPNGVIDGIAVGVLDRDEQGHFRSWKSTRSEPLDRADFVGMWPLGFNDDVLAERTPQISDGFGRETARAIITGAQLVGNGSHRF